MLFARQLLSIECGILQDVSENIDRKRRVFSQDTRVVMVCSMLVEAFSSPPTASISSAIPRAVRVLVPLKAICSRRWVIPF